MQAVDLSERWEQIQNLFDALMDLDPETRVRHLSEVQGSDPTLHDAIASLFKAFDVAGDFMGLLNDPLERLAPAPVRPALQEGTMIQAYQIVRPLGRGGMGEVYLARDQRLDRLVALKFLSLHLDANQEADERLYMEARATAALDHPNIATIFEVGEDPAGGVFIAMAYYPGQTLRERIAQGPLSVDEALAIATQVAAGLAAAHHQGIVHRDIKPANLLLSDHGPVKILDFGLAKRAGQDRTQGNRTMGTIAYMSPEQIRGEDIDHRTDLWSLGVVLYEILSGKRPFRGDHETSLLHAILHQDYAPLHTVQTDLPADLERIVAKALAKDPATRYQDAEALHQDLLRLQQGDTILLDPELAHTGTVTFFFSDTESTKTAPSDPTIHEALKRLMQNVLRAPGGREVDNGQDGIFAVFGKASDAVAAALAVQQAVAEHPWPNEAAISVKIGLHTGEPVVVDTTYGGAEVHRAVQIGKAAHGGQVLLSQVTHELAGHALPGGVRAVDLGLHRLKDLPAPERLFQLVIPGQPAHFPPLRTSGSWPTNLPVPMTELIGREEELRHLRHLIREQGARLITLTGPGGTGKTRLTVRLAADLAADFEDGVCFVSLAPIADPTLVASAVAFALGVREMGSASIRESLLRFLQDKHGLLVLDNFEHMMEAVEFVAELLTSCAFLTVVVTSRAPLHLQGEHEFLVPPLAVPEAPDLPPEQMLHYPSVALFVRRAQAIRPSFTLNTDNAVAVAEVCARLDGLPLAIELAAARVKVLSPRALVARLQHRFDVLEDEGRDRPTRHRTLREALAWSYELLSTTEQAFFRRLGVFAGGCSLEAVEAVCSVGIDTSSKPFGLLASLIDKSLLRQEEDADGEPRFTMLETIRAYALERLHAEHEEDETRQAHLTFFLDLVEMAAPELTGPDQVTWFDVLEREQNNLRAALTFALSLQSEAAARLAAALCRFWLARGFASEGYKRASATLAALEDALEPVHHAHLLLGVALLAANVSLFSKALQLLEQALGLLRHSERPDLTAEALNHMSWNLLCMGAHTRARACAHEAMALYRSLDHDRGVSVSLNNLGFSAFLQGDYGASGAYFTESLACCRKTGDLRSLSRTLTNLAFVLHHQGRLEEAVVLHEEAIATAEATRDPFTRAICQNRLILTQYELGREEKAATLLQDTLPLFRTMGHFWGTLENLYLLGHVLLTSGDVSHADAIYTEYLERARQLESKPWVALALCRQGEVRQQQNNTAGALSCFRESLRLRREMAAQAGAVECLEGLARVAFDYHQNHRAVMLLSAATTIRQQAHAPRLPHRRVAHKSLLLRLQAALGQVAYVAAWEQGEQIDDVVAYGLGED